MKALLTLLLLAAPALADATQRLPMPQREIILLSWGELPWETGCMTLRRDGGEWKVYNPNGVGCDPQSRSGDVFRCVVWLWFDEIVVIKGARLNPVW